MKKIVLIILLFIVGFLRAENLDVKIDVEQNIRALYKDINLTKEQEKYIVDSEEQNINTMKSFLIKESSILPQIIKNIDDKNIVQFELDKNGKIGNVELILKSHNKELDKITKSTIQKMDNQLALPREKIRLRYIFRYDVKDRDAKVVYENKNAETYIQRGTTKLEHSSKEYVRVFETGKDGFVNFSTYPKKCTAFIALLNQNGQKVKHGRSYWHFNIEIPKGKYKLLIQTKESCNINLEYP